MTKEVVTVQVGAYANYIGAHFWNLQDEYLGTPIEERELSPSTFFSEIAPGSRAYASGLRYAPRLQIIDASGGFGALSTQAGIVLSSSETPREAYAWRGEQEIIEREHVPHSKYVQHLHKEESGASADAADSTAEDPKLDDIEYWTDYLKVRLHPRTCFSLPGVHHEASNMDDFAGGVELAKPVAEDMFEDLRYFVEGCDCFGGLNVYTNGDDAFGGVTAGYLDHVYEELGTSASVMVWSAHNVRRRYGRRDMVRAAAGASQSDDMRYAMNEGYLIGKCMEYSAEYIPLISQRTKQLRLAHVDDGDVFQTSAILGLAIDVGLTPLRSGWSLSTMLSSLRPTEYATIGSLGMQVGSSGSKARYETSFFETTGATTNLSSRPDTRAHQRHGSELISSRGLTCTREVSSYTRQAVYLPVAFPAVFDASLRGAAVRDGTAAAHGVALDSVAAMAGLGCLAQDGEELLRTSGEALRGGLRRRARQSSQETCDLSELLRARADDYRCL